MPAAEPITASRANVYHVFAGRQLERRYHMVGGTWALYWDAGVLGVDPGWWLAETGERFAEKELLWAPACDGGEWEVPVTGWQLRGLNFLDYTDVPLKFKEYSEEVFSPCEHGISAALSAAPESLEPEPSGVVGSTTRPIFVEDFDSIRDAEKELRTLQEKLCQASDAVQKSARQAAMMAAMSLTEGYDKADGKALVALLFRSWRNVQHQERHLAEQDSLLMQTRREVRDVAKSAAMRAGMALVGRSIESLAALAFSAWLQSLRLSLKEAMMQAKKEANEAAKALAHQRREARAIRASVASCLLGSIPIAFLQGAFASWQRACKLEQQDKFRELVQFADEASLTVGSLEAQLTMSEAARVEAEEALQKTSEELSAIRESEMAKDLNFREIELTQALQRSEEELAMLRESSRFEPDLRAELAEAQKQVEALTLAQEKTNQVLSDWADGKFSYGSQSRLRVSDAHLLDTC
eukprot:TRINITY_DN109049_c0_g1_i1.p1 TRINITY_DN109049_c0_g1~~TRINITY_DN109049_c0_g1_i1.p1  ORF type:complete len:468 (+),score=108.36 TRINITY_DN109049_c0_g1_i1:285-1688(+)